MPTLFSPQPRRGHSGRVMRASSGRERRVTVHDIQRLCDMPASKPDGLNAIKLHAMAHPTCIRQDLSHGFMHGMLTLPCCARVSRPLADRFSRTVIDAAATQQRPTQWQQQQQHAITQQQLQQEQQHKQQQQQQQWHTTRRRQGNGNGGESNAEVISRQRR